MKIAILGLGTIGYGVYDLIKKSNLGIEVVAIFDRNKEKQALVDDIITSDINDILDNSNIDLIVETMGGVDDAYFAITNALTRKKHVVTANKDVVSLYMDTFNQLKKDNHVQFLFEASVGGGIPIITALKDLTASNDILKIEGIINGTTNFMLSRLEEGGTFNEALQLAKDNGFAESNPSSDLEGLDLVRKLAILVMVGLKKTVHNDDIFHFGITNITQDDVAFIKQYQRTIKLMACFDRGSLIVEPVAVSHNSLFSLIRDEYNYISITTNHHERLGFYGKGAGRYPTASAIVADIIAINNQKKDLYSENRSTLVNIEDNKPYVFYLRFKEKISIARDKIKHQDGLHVITMPMKRHNIAYEDIAFYARFDEKEG